MFDAICKLPTDKTVPITLSPPVSTFTVACHYPLARVFTSLTMDRLIGFIVLVFISSHTLVVGDELVYPCTSTPDCAPIQDSVCSLTENACVCPGGHILNSAMTKCLPVSGGYGSSCEETVQCAVRMLTGATCFYDSNTLLTTCKCQTGYHYLHGRCWKSVGLNEACTTSDQCFGNSNYESLSCSTSTGVCVCSDGFYLHGDQTYCRRAGTEPGDDCYFDFDCKFEGAFCNLGKKCEATGEDLPFEWDLNNDSTEEAGLMHGNVDAFNQPWSPLDSYIPNKECTTDDECTAMYANSECTPGNKCWCTQGYYFYGGSRCAKELGEPCTLNTDCNHITNGTCRIENNSAEGICSCNVYSTAGPNNQRCNRLRPELEFGCQSQNETCQNFGPQCECVPIGDFVQCHCSSTSHFEPETQTCWVNKGFGESCLDDRDCLTASGEGGVNCIGGTCQCIDGYHETAKDCRKDGLVYGDMCIDDLDCFFVDAKCMNSTCLCNAGYYTTINIDGVVECTTGLGGSCNVTSDCAHVPQATCNDTTSMCVCESDTLVPSENPAVCLDVAMNYGDACAEDVQCQTLFGYDILCTDETCMCREEYHFKDNTCWPIALLNEKCNTTNQCYVPSDSERTECRNGLCECRFEYPTNLENNDCTSGGDGVHQKMGVLSSILLVTYFLIASSFSKA